MIAGGAPRVEDRRGRAASRRRRRSTRNARGSGPASAATAHRRPGAVRGPNLDPDADHVGDRRILQRLDEALHALERLDRLGVCGDGHGRLRQIAAQRGMQRGAAFGRVDVLAVEQGLQAFSELGRFGEIEQCVERGAVVTLAREVRVERTDAQREPGRARRVVGDQRAQREPRSGARHARAGRRSVQ
jgi:hypothetical protein